MEARVVSYLVSAVSCANAPYGAISNHGSVNVVYVPNLWTSDRRTKHYEHGERS